MRIAALILVILLVQMLLSAQQNGPWNSPLRIASSSDGRTFGPSEVFQDSAGVPSVTRWRGDTLVCAFQWFREPRGAASWDRVAVKFSYDDGTTWTQPTPVVIRGLPTQYQRPFDPALVVVDQKLRMYFSSSDGMPMGGLSAIVNTYSAISDDGITYEFELGARFDMPTKPVIDPSVVYYRGQWHFTAPIGAPQEGAYHSVSPDGLLFDPRPPYPSDNAHNWTGNFVFVHDSALRFYGSGPTLWYKESADAESWGPFVPTNVMGGDPSVIQTRSGRYLMVYVGPRYPTSIDQTGHYDMVVGQQTVRVPFDPVGADYEIYALAGDLLVRGTLGSEHIKTSYATQPVFVRIRSTDHLFSTFILP